MTAPAVSRPAERARLRPQTSTVVTGTIAVVGCGLLAARPALVNTSPVPVATLGLLFLALLVLGARLPLPRTAPAPRTWTTTSTVVFGALAFAVGRLVVGGHPPATATLFLIATNTLAAVAEEAWFRRLCFGLLAPAGTAIAMIGSTVLFAAVHVSIYGVWVLPLDLAAGLVFAWQRSVTGSWTAPAITHVIANLLVVL